MKPVAGFPARPPVRSLVAAVAPNPKPDLEETPVPDPAPREYRVDPGSATRIALHVMDDLWVDCTRDRALTSQDVEGWTRLAPAEPVPPATDTEPRKVCSKCGTSGCVEDAESGWYS